MERRKVNQASLFPEAKTEAGSLMPEGLRYRPELISEREEETLVSALGTLPFKPFEFHGNRRVVSFGLRYDYDRRGVEAAAAPPDFLDDLRGKVARFAGCAAEDFRQVGINEYQTGAGVGWHRDKPQFGHVVGVSLVSALKIRFRKTDGERDGREQWFRASKILEARSAYIMTGASRGVWEHSVPPVKTLRYSVMFRTLAGPVELLANSDAETTARG